MVCNSGSYPGDNGAICKGLFVSQRTNLGPLLLGVLCIKQQSFFGGVGGLCVEVYYLKPKRE